MLRGFTEHHLACGCLWRNASGTGGNNTTAFEIASSSLNHLLLARYIRYAVRISPQTFSVARWNERTKACLKAWFFFSSPLACHAPVKVPWTPHPPPPNNASWAGQEPTNSSHNMASASGFQRIDSLFHNVTACKCAVPVRHLLSVAFFCGLWRWRQMMCHCFSSWENKEGKFSLLAEESETYAIANVDLQSNLSSFWVHIKHLPSQLFPFQKQTCLIQPHNKIQDSLRSLHNIAGISLCRIKRQCKYKKESGCWLLTLPYFYTCSDYPPQRIYHTHCKESGDTRTANERQLACWLLLGHASLVRFRCLQGALVKVLTIFEFLRKNSLIWIHK